jgi:hypothetical protein
VALSGQQPELSGVGSKMKVHRPLRVVDFFLDIGGCVRKDRDEMQRP